MFVSFPAQGWGEERITVMQSLWSKGGGERQAAGVLWPKVTKQQL